MGIEVATFVSRHLSFCFYLLSVAGLLKGQCYDLRSVQLHHPVGHFHEEWDHPIWNAKPGEGNFTVDERAWGGASEFAIFSVGVAKKTPSGWVPFRSHRTPEVWCDPTPKRSGSLCYELPYQLPPVTAVYRVEEPVHLEEWSLSTSGIINYREQIRGQTKVIEARTNILSDDLNAINDSLSVSVLDLNKMEYSYHFSGTSKGPYKRRIVGGVTLSRNVKLTAKVSLNEVACPASINKVDFRPGPAPIDRVMQAAPVCAAKVRGNPKTANKTGFSLEQFLTNPFSISTAENCVLVFDDDPPESDNKIAAAR